MVREVESPSPYAEYLLITDNPELKSNTWKIIYDKDLDGLSVFEKCYSVRFNPYKYCNTDICFRIDGSMKILKPLDALVQYFVNGNYDIALIIHPSRNRIDEEYFIWGLLRKFEVASIDKALTMLSNSSYNLLFKGLFQLGFCITKNKPEIDAINTATLSLLLDLGKGEGIHRVDQTIFSYVLNTHRDGIKVMPLDDEFLHSYYIQICQHNSICEIPSPKNQIRPYMFNKRVKTIKSFDVSNAERKKITRKSHRDITVPNHDYDKNAITGALDTLSFFIKNSDKHKIRQTFLTRCFVYYGYHVLYGKYKCLFSEEERNCLANQIKSEKLIHLGIEIKYVIRHIRGEL
ncbi:MAG: hypothetical protein MJY80_01080 [Bacteroidales bacterium]|nr:hypothetical protein [Bacteroidales bacterium]